MTVINLVQDRKPTAKQLTFRRVSISHAQYTTSDERAVERILFYGLFKN
jgi:hypothetical protein